MGRPSQTDQDVADLRRLGYAQELFRTMGGFSNFAISFSIISILTGAVTLFDYGLAMGGPAEMAFGWPLVFVFTLMVALSMGELAASYPTSGGNYHWAAILGGRSWGWFTAWFNIIGLTSAIAGIDYGCAQFLTPLLGLPSSTRGILAVYAAILISHGLINHFGIRLVAWLNDLSVAVHIAGVLVIVAALLLFAPRQPLSFFVQTSTESGKPYWWAFILGLLQAQWTFTGYDASAHVSEETVDPRRRVPWGMVMSVVVSAVAGYLLLFALTLSIRSVPAVLNATDAQGNHIPAVVAILQQSLGNLAGSLMSALTAAAMWFCGLSAVTSNSRMIYAFARDAGLPLSALWQRVSAKHLTPAPAIWFSIATAFLALVWSGAYSVVTSISTIALYFSYGIPVLLKFVKRGSALWQAFPGWHLGRHSHWINLVAIAWTIFICGILVMPPNELSGKTIAGMTAGLALWYWASERHRYRGPRLASETLIQAAEAKRDLA
jgi:amino acid transporter